MRTGSSSSRQAPLKRPKPAVGAAGPVEVFEASSTRFGAGGARSAARRHGEVSLRTRLRKKEARGRVAISSAQSACARARSAARSAAQRAEFSSARVGVGEGAVACRSIARRRGDVFLGAGWRGQRRWPAVLLTSGGLGRY